MEYPSLEVFHKRGGKYLFGMSLTVDPTLRWGNEMANFLSSPLWQYFCMILGGPVMYLNSVVSEFTEVNGILPNKILHVLLFNFFFVLFLYFLHRY